jgi:hypothetical protein
MVTYQWRGRFTNEAMNALHAWCFEHEPRRDDWWARVNDHSLGWVCASRTLIAVAAERAAAKRCEWLHADFEEHLRGFYVDGVGFTSTRAGVLRLPSRPGAMSLRSP